MMIGGQNLAISLIQVEAFSYCDAAKFDNMARIKYNHKHVGNTK